MAGLGLALLLLACALAAPAGAGAAAQLSWSSAKAIAGAGGHPIAGISCLSSSSCLAVDRTSGSGDVLSGDPHLGSSWGVRYVDGSGLNGISCASSALCVAVDDAGNAIASSDPLAGPWRASPIDGGRSLAAISCPSTSRCVAVDDAGEVLVSSRPASGSWVNEHAVDGGVGPLQAISCASESLCAASSSSGAVIVSSAPMEAGSWHTGTQVVHALGGVSCAAPGFCVGVDGFGDGLASADPLSAAPTWSSTAIDVSALTSISCLPSGLCVALDEAGDAIASDDPAGIAPGWSLTSDGLSASRAAVSCLTEGFCAAAGAKGEVVAGELPPPSVITGGPGEITLSAATVSGIVNPEDAPLLACRIEYGLTSAYGQSVPCQSTPGPGSAAVGVSARLSGLSPATAYHYRLIAIGATGEGMGADGTFTTAAPSSLPLVRPAPYITGIPANGDRLACNPGVPHSSTASLAYAWWRDSSPIKGASKQLYQIGLEDAGQHLQCEVIATNEAGSASARSPFVTVPAQGVPISAGETTIGLARLQGAVLQLPVSCSPEAYLACRLTVRLTAVETLRGRRVLAVTARAPLRRSPRSRSLPVTLLSAKTTVPAGAQRTISVRVNPTGRRLIVKARRLSAKLTVEGTILGVLNATLAKQRVSARPATAAVRRRHVGLGRRAGVGSQADVGHRLGFERAPAAESRRHADAARLEGAQAPSAKATGSTSSPGSAAALAPTPYMGWDTYLALGPRVSESVVLAQASRMVSDGLQKAGYDYVWLDVGWWQGQRAGNGEITVNRSQWPHGMLWLTKTLHKAGFRVGLYTDAGIEGCGGRGQGSYGHYVQDANTFAAWGFDAVKVDFCGAGRMRLNPASAYGAFHAALAHNSSHRPMLLSICNFREPGQQGGEPPYGESAFASYGFGPSDGNSWRTDTDVGFPGFVTFSWVMRNLDADAAHPESAGPGHWNDPDYLAPDQGLTAGQFKAQMSMWAVLAAPLMASDNLTTIAPASLGALKNAEVIAIDQDPAGIQGKLLSSSGEGEVWVKPLYGGRRAVALLNRGYEPVQISTSAAAVGMPHASSYSLRNVWTHSTLNSGGNISAQVRGESVVLLEVSASH